MKGILLIILTTSTMLQTNIQEIAFGGGCFWCTEAVFKNLDGIIEISPGYAGGNLENPKYNDVVTGQTGHAEVVKIRYDQNIIPFEKLLEVFFTSHDPTSLNKQGADIGTQYRSIVLYTTENQKNKTHEAIKRLDEKKIYQNKIVTQTQMLETFYPAEKYHHNYFENNNEQAYCRFVIQPKVDKINRLFNDLLKEQE